MEYHEILAKIQTDENNDHRTDLYRYNGLLEAIRFFSNRLTLDQIIDSCFDFVNELLTVEKSALYVLNGNSFVLSKKRNLKTAPETIEATLQLTTFALYVGNVVTEKNLRQYFDDIVINSLDASVMLPLLLDGKLYGFLLLSRRITGPFNDNDILVCDVLMNLFNNSMESCMRLERLQTTNRELDEKIFNLFAINQSAKAMLTEHRLDALYNLAVDVFSELTQSANTGFVLYDEASEKYCLKAYRDVFHSGGSCQISLSLKPGANDKPEIPILDLSKKENTEFFNSLFYEGIDILSGIKAKYVVFIYGQKSRILGFVTLSDTISGSPYKKSAFELVDSLASYTYIALTNAMLINIVNEQKVLLQKKLDRLITLNRLSKNINSALDSNSLLELALETLLVSFRVESAIFALYNEESNSLRMAKASDSSLDDMEIPMNTYLEPLKSGRIIYESSTDNLPLIIGTELSGAVRSNSGVLIIPMTLDHYNPVLVGALLLFKIKDGSLSDEENILTFETVANQIAPMIDGFMRLEKQKDLLRQDMAKIFVHDLEEQIRECEKYDFDMDIIRVLDNDASPWHESVVNDILSLNHKNVYPVSYCQTEIILLQDFEYNYRLIAGALADQNVSINRYHYKKDFRSCEEYLNLRSAKH